MFLVQGKRGAGCPNWGKYFIGLFHVSEHADHFKAIQIFHEKKTGNSLVGAPPCLVKKNYFPLLFCKASLRANQL